MLHWSLTEQGGTANASNKWYSHWDDWVARTYGTFLYGSESMKVEEGKCSEASKVVEPMVPADESQVHVSCAGICSRIFMISERKNECSRVQYTWLTHMGFITVLLKVTATSWFHLSLWTVCRKNSVQDLGMVNGVKMVRLLLPYPLVSICEKEILRTCPGKNSNLCPTGSSSVCP